MPMVSFASELEAHGGCGVKYGMPIVPPPFLIVLPHSVELCPLAETERPMQRV